MPPRWRVRRQERCGAARRKPPQPRGPAKTRLLPPCRHARPRTRRQAARRALRSRPNCPGRGPGQPAGTRSQGPTGSGPSLGRPRGTAADRKESRESSKYRPHIKPSHTHLSPPKPYPPKGPPAPGTAFAKGRLRDATGAWGPPPERTNLRVAHTPHEPHAPHPGPTVTQQANDLLDVTASYLSHNNLIVHPTKSVAMIKGSATPHTLGPKGPPMQVVTTTTHLRVIQAANPEDATLPPKLQSHLAHLPRYASPTTKALSLSHQSPAYYLTGVLNASIGFQAVHLTHPTTALQPATRPVTKAWAAHGGWPTSIPTRAIQAAWPHYGDAIGDEVKAAYTRHTALLLHRMTHNHSPEVRVVTTIRLQAAQQARNTCPRWVLHQTGMPTDMNSRLWNHLQLLLPSPHHAILTNHTCPEEGPLAVLCGDLHHHPKGTIHTIDLVGASITVVYVTLPEMRVLHHSGAHHTPFLQLLKWPQYRLFHQYLTQTARAAGHTLPGSKDMRAAYRDFKKQHPRPIPATRPYAPTGSKHEPVSPVTGPVPPITLLLAPYEAKPTQTTVIHHGAKWRIPKRHMTARDLPRVPHDSQSMPRTCWACDSEEPTTPWPVLHLIARQHTHPTTHLPPQAYAWVAPRFDRTDTNPTVAWNPDHAPKWLFTTTPTWPRPDPAACTNQAERASTSTPTIRSTTPATHRSTEHKPSHATT